MFNVWECLNCSSDTTFITSRQSHNILKFDLSKQNYISFWSKPIFFAFIQHFATNPYGFDELVKISAYTLWRFPVGGNQSTWRKPTTFGRALTNSFHIIVMSLKWGSNPQSQRWKALALTIGSTKPCYVLDQRLNGNWNDLNYDTVVRFIIKSFTLTVLIVIIEKHIINLFRPHPPALCVLVRHVNYFLGIIRLRHFTEYL